MLEPLAVMDGTSRISDILSRHPKDSRLTTYGLALSHVPLSFLEKAEKVIEVGMNNRLFVFEDLFKGNTKFLGITLDPNHKAAALNMAKKVGHSVEVRLQDLKDGLPKDWNEADLAMDIFSASNYWDMGETVKILAGSLKKDGYLIVVSGDILGGIEELVRKDPENKDFHPDLTFDLTGEKPKLRINIEPGITAKEDQQKRMLEILRENLKLAGYEVTNETTMTKMISLLKDMAKIVGEKFITSFDGLNVYQYHLMEKAGLRNIKRFLTPDGTGMIAQK